jgi:RNA polymerase sigma-70 factor (ECF subfamily)
VTADFAETLSRGRQGDRTALEALFGPWRGLLRLQADQLLGVELSARVDPSDVVQEALAQAFATLGGFRGSSEGEWVNWLRAIVAGQAANAQRHHSAGKRSPGRERQVDTAAQADRAAGPDGQAIFREDDARLAAAIAALPADMRAVVVRRVFHREPFEAVAQAVGRTPGAARVLWTRALRRLRELVCGPATNHPGKDRP